MTVHPGSWLGLPDFGITEKLQSVLKPNNALTNQGGSNLIGGYNAPASSGLSSPDLGAVQGPVYSGPQGSVLGKSTSNLSSPNLSTAQTQQAPDIYGQQADAAQSAYQAQLTQANALYGNYQTQLQQQQNDIQNQKTNSLNDLQTTLDQAGTTAQNQKNESQRLSDTAIGQAGDTARSTQRVNRNVLRALGILGSTYAADKLQEPMNAFDQQRAQVVATNQDNTAKIDQWYQQQQTAHQNAVKSLEDNYSSLLGKIQNDMRFSDQQKIAAAQNAGAAYEQSLAQIGQSFVAAQQQAEQAKQSLATQIAGLQLNATPTANLSDIYSKSLATAGQVVQPITSGIFDPQKRQQLLSGLS